jgi:mevalonate pyrophosphate decarboxylase
MFVSLHNNKVNYVPVSRSTSNSYQSWVTDDVNKLHIFFCISNHFSVKTVCYRISVKSSYRMFFIIPTKYPTFTVYVGRSSPNKEK